jgi:4'-phosphopantetheinyl transferase
VKPWHAHVWRIDLDDESWDAARVVLSAEEAERANRFHTPALRRRRGRCQAAVRCILADYLQMPAATLAFVRTTSGKPELPGSGLQFSLSHSGRQALLAVARVALGVDIQVCEAAVDLEAMERWACHGDERAALERMPSVARREAFYRLWTHKEAYSKALGVGLRLGFRSLRLDPLHAGDVARIVDEQPGLAPEYYAYDLTAFAGHAACVSLPIENARIWTRAAEAGRLMNATPAL